MKKVNKKLSLNKNVVTGLNVVTGGFANPSYFPCTGTGTGNTQLASCWGTCGGATCANTCANTCAAGCTETLGCPTNPACSLATVCL